MELDPLISRVAAARISMNMRKQELANADQAYLRAEEELHEAEKALKAEMEDRIVVPRPRSGLVLTGR